MKSVARRKLILTNLEILLIQKSGLFKNDLPIFCKDLTIFGKVEDPPNSSNLKIPSNNMVGWKG
jgi:hypothetical protein